MNTYSFFLFTKLYEAVNGNGLSDEPYDYQYEAMSHLYKQYEASEYNDSYEPEYECMLSFLESYKSSNQ
jgi:hypothetical protein